MYIFLTHMVSSYEQIPGKKHLSTTNYTFKRKIRIFHQNRGLSLENYQF